MQHHRNAAGFYKFLRAKIKIDRTKKTAQQNFIQTKRTQIFATNFGESHVLTLTVASLSLGKPVKLGKKGLKRGCQNLPKLPFSSLPLVASVNCTLRSYEISAKATQVFYSHALPVSRFFILSHFSKLFQKTQITQAS